MNEKIKTIGLAEMGEFKNPAIPSDKELGIIDDPPMSREAFEQSLKKMEAAQIRRALEDIAAKVSKSD